MSTGLTAGVDIRRMWEREASGATGNARRPYEEISRAVNQGVSVTDAVNATESYFPKLFRELVRVGEQSGKLPEVLRQLAESYDEQLKLRRMFMSAILWPAFQLLVALLIVGFLIWVVGFIAKMNGGPPLDLIGLGLVGNSGLLIYILFLTVVFTAAAIVYGGIRRGVLWARPIQRVVMRVPRVGKALRTLALARLAWSLHVTLEAGMDLARALRLSLSSTQNLAYTEGTDQVLRAIARGDEIHEALAATGAYPVEFLDTVEVGERSGRLVESMGGLSRQYQEEARSALQVLTVFGGFAVWAMVAVLIIVVIFRIFSVYLGMIQGAMH